MLGVDAFSCERLHSSARTVLDRLTRERLSPKEPSVPARGPSPSFRPQTVAEHA
jgi:hypothetical protein